MQAGLLSAIISDQIIVDKSMTFSEFISLYAKQAYLNYCASNKLEPELDIKIQEPKICALLKKKPNA